MLRDSRSFFALIQNGQNDFENTTTRLSVIRLSTMSLTAMTAVGDGGVVKGREMIALRPASRNIDRITKHKYLNSLRGMWRDWDAIKNLNALKCHVFFIFVFIHNVEEMDRRKKHKT